MKIVHLAVQGKGGTGKTLISAVTAQYLISHYNAGDIHLFDTDPINQSFSRYKALNVEVVNIVGANGVIDHSKFDMLIEEIINRNGIALIDSGSTTFLPLMQYIKENGVLEVLNEHGVEVIFHIPLQGGGGFSDTIEGLRTILDTLPVKVVVWLNHNQGEIVFNTKNLIEKYPNKIIGVCEIKNRQGDLYDSDIRRMTENHLTLEEIKQSTDPQWRLMSKQRINIFYRDIDEQLAKITLFDTAVKKSAAKGTEKETAA